MVIAISGDAWNTDVSVRLFQFFISLLDCKVQPEPVCGVETGILRLVRPGREGVHS